MPKIVLTEDGTPTLISDKFGVSYHSMHGAWDEAMVVFIMAGIDYRIKQQAQDEYTILEIGFGTGLNALITYAFSEYMKAPKIAYTGYEKYPISIDLAAELKYPDYFPDNDFSQAFSEMHLVDTQRRTDLGQFFTFEKRLEDFQSISEKGLYDVVYFDAFAPNAQSEFWDAPFLQKIYDSMTTHGVLTTYCAKGSFKRALKKVGFQIEALPGPGRKREMTRAIKV